MIRPGPRNPIADVSGVAVGDAEDHGVRGVFAAETLDNRPGYRAVYGEHLTLRKT